MLVLKGNLNFSQLMYLLSPYFLFHDHRYVFLLTSAILLHIFVGGIFFYRYRCTSLSHYTVLHLHQSFSFWEVCMLAGFLWTCPCLPSSLLLSPHCRCDCSALGKSFFWLGFRCLVCTRHFIAKNFPIASSQCMCTQ